MYQRKETIQDKLAFQFMSMLTKRGLNPHNMSYGELIYEWACFINDKAVYAHEYNGIENKVRFPKTMLGGIRNETFYG